MGNSVETILKKYHLRFTDCRKEVLTVFTHQKHAISHAFLEGALLGDHDRVTIYRTLHTFLEKGIIHKVLDEGGSSKYALCSDHCADNHHHHDHVHFKCIKCHETSCLDQVHIPAFDLPLGFIAKEIGILVQGVCDQCAKS